MNDVFEIKSREKSKYVYENRITDIDKNKKTVFILGGKNGFHMTYGFIEIIKNELAKKYNVINVTTENCNNCIKINLDRDIYYRKNENKNFKELNSYITEKSLDILFNELNFEVDFLINGFDLPFILSQQSFVSKKEDEELYKRKNYFFDYVKTETDIDKKRLKIIEEKNKNIRNNYFNIVLPTAFLTNYKYLYNYFIKKLYEDKGFRFIAFFSIDPAIYTPLYKNIPHKFFYFADDKRGTRNFDEFKIAQIQKILYEKSEKQDKTKLFIHFGTLLHNDSPRVEIWNEFLNNLDLDNSNYFIPAAHPKQNGEKNTRGENARIEKFKDFFNEIKNHKLYNEGISAKEMGTELSKYKYGFIARCISYDDSLNFRPVWYTYLDVLPLLDYKYDPDYLQIPKYIQDKIRVYNSNGIKEKIKYFENNPNERKYILNELKNILNVNDFINNPELSLEKEINKLIK